MKENISLYVLLLQIIFTFSSEAFSTESSINMLSDTDDGVSFELKLPSFEFTDIKDSRFKQVSAEGFGIITQTGAPGVIVKGVLIELPPACDIDVQVYSLEKIRFENFSLAPTPQRMPVEDKKGARRIVEQYRKESSAYSTDAFFPGKLAMVEFTGYLRDRRVARLNLFPVQYNPVTKELDIHKRLKVNLRFQYHSKPKTNDNDVIAKNSHRNNSPFEKIYKSCLLNYKHERPYRPVKRSNKKVSSVNALASENNDSPFALKAVIEKEGIYKITYDDLNAHGIDLSSATNENLKIKTRGEEIAIYCSGKGQFKSGDYIVFYGESFKSLYSKKNVYWIYQSDQNGKRMSEINGSPTAGYPVKTAFKNIYHAEQDRIYLKDMPPWDEPDNCFWEEFSIIKPPLSKDFSVYLQNIDKSSYSYSIKINLKGETSTEQDPDHHTRVYINGELVDDFTWDGQVEHTQEIVDIPSDYFKEGVNTVTVEADNDTGAIVDSYFLDWFEIEYWDRFVADNDSLKFYSEVAGGVAFKIEGFTGNDVSAFDITDPLNVKRITNASITQNRLTHTIHFEDKGLYNKTYYALSSDTFKTPAELVVDEPSDLSTERDGVDYIIISHENFYEGIQELKSYRESRGLNVEVAKIQDIYDEFSYGIKDAEAIKGFLSHAYTNWHSTNHPTYVLLVGDATVDYRDDLGYYAQGQKDFVPTYIYIPGEGNTPTDNWFVCVEGSDDLPDMVIGRLCVKTEEDLQNIIEKIKNYEQGELLPWCGNVILAADNEPPFESMSDNLGSLLPDGTITAQKVYLSEYDDDNIDSAKDDLINKINAGAVITNYLGHGWIDWWAAKNFFSTSAEDGSDVDRLTNGDKLTLVISLTCLNGFFANFADDYCTAEEFVRAQDKGAVACIATTGSAFPYDDQVLGGKIFNEFFVNGTKIVGFLFYSAKVNTYNETGSIGIVKKYTLFGDPATELKLASGSSFDFFELYTPKNGEILLKRPPYTFTWGQGQYKKIKVQYSTDAVFSSKATITVPFLTENFISSGQYTPNIFIWTILRIMNSRNKRLYWRVVSYDDDLDSITPYSNYRSFSIGY